MNIIETSPWSRTATLADLKGSDVRWVARKPQWHIDPLVLIGAVLLLSTAGQAIAAMFGG